MCRLITGPLPGPSELHIAQPLALPAQEDRKPRRDLEGPGEGVPGPGKTDGVPLWTSVHSFDHSFTEAAVESNTRCVSSQVPREGLGSPGDWMRQGG